MGEDVLDVVRAIFDAINERQLDGGGARVAPDAELVDVATRLTFSGPDGWKRNRLRWLGAFPDLAVEVRNIVASGEWAAVEYRLAGTHAGPLELPAGPVPATERSVLLEACDVVRVGDGKLVTARTYYDLASLLAQLGLGSTAAAAPA